jgi:ATP-binding cassette, subfamily B, bacterial
VQVLGREDHELDRMKSATARGLSFNLRVADLQARVDPLLTVSTSLLTALVLLVAAVMVLQHTLSVGQLTLVLAYTRGTYAAIRQLAKMPVQAQKSAVAAERLAETFARETMVREPAHPKPLPWGPLSISFENVTFGYTMKRPVLKEITWQVPTGATVALVGATGTGKTTLLSLIPRLYDPWTGVVRLGGVDVSQVSLAELRRRVSLVLQESLLFRDTVYNNIAYGRPEASETDVLAAADVAGVFRFIDQLEDGFDTVISERGSTLSGGQKQCVAIARALLRNAPVVLMDEPTSNLDAATEKLVIEGMRRLMAGRTSIVIAHRFTTIQHADLVGVLQGGRLVQTGTPEQLMAQGGLFASLAEMQKVRLR